MANKEIEDFDETTAAGQVDALLIQRASDDTQAYTQLDNFINGVGIVNDLTPVLGGDLNASSRDITNVVDISISGLMNIGVNTFPGSPSTNDVFYRDDLSLMCFYDGTRWLTVKEYSISLPEFTASAHPTNSPKHRISTTRDIYVTAIASTTFVVTTNDGTDYWDLRIIVNATGDSAGTGSIKQITTSSDSPDTETDHDVAPATAAPADNAHAYMRFLKTNSPGDITAGATIYYREIVT